MTDINHRRKNRKPVNQRYRPEEYHNGYAPREARAVGGGRTGNTDYLDKSMHGWGADAPLSGEHFRARIPNDFTDGHRGMARAVKGAKKFVRTRVRFHENASTRKIAEEAHAAGPEDGADE